MPCDELVADGGDCGADHGHAVCRNCCSRLTGTCGSDDGTGMWCGADNLAEYSYVRLDPAGTRCPAWRVAGFKAPPLE